MKKQRQLNMEYRAKLELAAKRLPTHIRKVGVLSFTFSEVDKIVEPFCRIYQRDDTDNVRDLLRGIVEKVHAQSRAQRSRHITIACAQERFEGMRARLKEFEKALKLAKAVTERDDWEELQGALISLPGIMDDMARSDLKAAAQSMLDIYGNLRECLHVDDVCVKRKPGHQRDIYLTIAIHGLVNAWTDQFPHVKLVTVSKFPTAPRSKTGVFAAFAKAAWHDLSFEADDLTEDRLNDAIGYVRSNREKNA